MTRDAVIFGIAGTMFGLLAGWIIGSQQVRPVPAAPAAVQSAAPAPGASDEPPAPPLDLRRASELEQQANAKPDDVTARLELGNLYFDAKRFDLAIPWYEAALRLNPKDIGVSTDLAVCYHYTGDADRALRQIDQSLAIDPKHAKTLLNQGIIRAFGKQDLDGALESWEKVVKFAPNSPEAERARQGLDGLKAAHKPGAPGAPAGGAAGS
jgi:cytochrome c-type biogenesis protein CcmH/NrfG